MPPPGAARAASPKPEFDDAMHAYFTATIQVDGRYQAWIHVRTTGETLRLFEGDAVKVGLFDGKIVSIEPRMLVVKCNDEELHVELGHNLPRRQGARQDECRLSGRIFQFGVPRVHKTGDGIAGFMLLAQLPQRFDKIRRAVIFVEVFLT